jgi:uncharacterized glyoxalase superfamily protein PhnB
MNMMKVAATLIVDTVEPSLNFWTERLRFTKVAEVPGASGLDFALLTNEHVEVHLQSRVSATKDIPYFADSKNPSSSFLYIDVEDVKSWHERLKDCDIILPLQKTFYGATHFFIKEPGGHVIGLSQNE